MTIIKYFLSVNVILGILHFTFFLLISQDNPIR